METFIEALKDLKGWQKLLGILILAGATVAVIYFQSGGEDPVSKTVGDINQSTGVGEVSTGNGDTNINTSGNNSVSF